MILVALFAAGGGIAADSNIAAMLIAGRTVQALGSGGILVLVDLIICDLVPLRERGKYLELMLSTAATGTFIGSLAAGGLVQASWRWVLYVNLSFSETALMLMLLFLRFNHEIESSWRRVLACVDYVGISSLLLHFVLSYWV